MPPAFDFPAAPPTGTTVTMPDNSFRTWDGIKWRAAPSAGSVSTDFLPLVGGTLTGPLTLAGDATQPLHPVSYQQMQPLLFNSPYVQEDGGAPMTGPLTLSGNATQPLHAVPLQQLTSAVAGAGVGTFLPLAGGIVSGATTLGAGGSLAGTFTGTPTWSGAHLFSATGNITCNSTTAPLASYITNFGRGGTFSYSGQTTADPTKYGLWANNNVSGTFAGTYLPVVANITASGMNIAAPNALVTVLSIAGNTGGAAAAGGTWQGFEVDLNDASVTNDKAAGTLGYWVTAQINRRASKNQGGTGLTPTTAYGGNWGLDVINTALSGATNLSLQNGIEINTAISAGASVMRRAGLQISAAPGHVNRAAMWDNAILIASGGGVSHRNALAIGGLLSANSVLGTDSKMLTYELAQDHTATANFGVELNDVTFTTAAIRTPGFMVDPNGVVSIGTGYLTASASGLAVDAKGSVGTGTPTINAGGTGFTTGTNNTIADDGYGGIYILAASGGAVTGVTTVVRQPTFNSTSPPATLAVTARAPSVGAGCVLGVTWNTTATTLSLQPSGGAIIVSGATTFSASGTALTVTNNATFGGAAAVTLSNGTIAATSGQNLALNLGGSGKTLTVAGTGGTGTLAVFTATAGANTVDYTTTAGVMVKSYFNLVSPSGLVWSGAYSPAKSPLHIGFSPSGTITPVSNGSQYMQWVVSSDTAAIGTGSTINMINIQHNAGGAAMTGNRSALNVSMSQIATTGNAGGGSIFQAGQATSNCSFNEGGTALTGVGAAGANYAWPEYARLYSGATFFYVNKAKEIGLQIASGASAAKNIGIDVVLLSTHAVQGALMDYAYGVQSQVGSTVGFKTAFQLGTFDGQDPFGSTSAVMRWSISGNPSVKAPQLATGIDLSLGAISGNAFASNNFAVAGSGTTSHYQAKIAQTGSGVSIDIPNYIIGYTSISSGGTGITPGDWFADATSGLIVSATTVSGGVVTVATLQRNGYQSSAPGTVTVTNMNPDRTSQTFVVNASATLNNTLSLQPSGGTVQVGSGCIAVNGSVATVLGSLGPVGSHTAVQEWIAVKNASGVTRYIPAF